MFQTTSYNPFRRHIRNVKHIGYFVIVSEEAIQKGVRRITAITGLEAERAQLETEIMMTEVNSHVQNIEAVMATYSENKTRAFHELVEKNTALFDKLSRTTISQCIRDQLREKLKNVKKLLDAHDKTLKAAAQDQLLEDTRQLVERLMCGNGDCQSKNFVVHVFQDGASAKTLSTALKLLERECPTTAFMAISSDPAIKKIICLASVPECLRDRGLKANEWVTSIYRHLDGKGGGKPSSAQASGTITGSLDELVGTANAFARVKLNT